MPAPDGFSWVQPPLLAGMARPGSAEELVWLRQQGIDLILSLTEHPLRRDWINDAGLFSLHLPVEDFTPPTPQQLDQAIAAILKATEQNRGVAVHCEGGLGRTGTVLACYLLTQNHPVKNALARIRRLRPGSVETPEQEQAVEAFARHWKATHE